MDQAGHPAAASRSGQDAAAGEADAHASASSFLPGTRNHARAFVASSAANVSPQNLLSNGKAQLLTASGATVPLPVALLDSGSEVSIVDQAFCDAHGIVYSSAQGMLMRTADARLGEIVGVTEEVLLVLADGTPQRAVVPLSMFVLPGISKPSMGLAATTGACPPRLRPVQPPPRLWRQHLAR